MVKLNPHFSKLSSVYFFKDLEKRVAEVRAQHPTAVLIDLGIGDVTKPLPPTLLAALCSGAQEMGERHSFRGYGPSAGYPFLREAIAHHDYRHLGLSADEIFVSNGAKCDLASFQDLFAEDNQVAICDPTFPVYVDTTVMAGRTKDFQDGHYEGIHYIPCHEEDQFVPSPPSVPCDLIFLCSPNNPTGVALDRKALGQWVDYARQHRAILIYDGAYEAFISGDDHPHSIYEIEGAKEVAIEIRSFSKTAGFTGLRCSYSVVPKELRAEFGGGEVALQSLWRRRHDTKFGGVPYLVQKCAAATYTPEGQKEVRELVQIYKDRTRFLLEGLKKIGYTVFGGVHAPYIWCKTPRSLTSVEFANLLLEKARIISIPGRGFGRRGEGFVRFSAFAEPTALADALLRLKNLL